MKLLQETTKWDLTTQPNHVYLVDGDKITAYQPFGTGTVVHFKKPMRFDQARRSFKQLAVDAAVWGNCVQRIVQVAGSKGSVYQVNLDANTCTCTGFQYRGRCKHIEQAAA
jgi:hypothetical protein